jgi:hypothetical protein
VALDGVTAEEGGIYGWQFGDFRSAFRLRSHACLGGNRPLFYSARNHRAGSLLRDGFVSMRGSDCHAVSQTTYHGTPPLDL